MSSPATIVHSATAALRRNVLRTALSTLSLAIGVAAVVTIVGLGRGARAAVEDQVMSAGTNLVIVSAGNRTASGVRLGMGSSSQLVNADADAIARDVRNVSLVSPGVRIRQQLVNGRNNWSATVEGVGADWPAVRHWSVASGTFFGTQDVQAAEKVCVIGAAVKDALFDSAVPAVGQDIRIGIQVFRVLGVMARKGQSSGGQDQDDAVFVPYTTAQKKLLNVTYLRNIFLVSRTDDVTGVARDVRQFLRLRHGITPDKPDDFRVRTLEEIVAVRTHATRTMTALLSGAAAVSLLVGGVGVMNIMLVSVTERTREIGLRLAIGARERDVQAQFLTEAVLLSICGGGAGIGAGILLAHGITDVLAWPIQLGAETIAGAVFFSAAIGVFFGWYPARQAAKIDPIDALRFE